MFALNQENELRQLTVSLKNKTFSSDEIHQLRQIIEYADWCYYVQDNPLLADVEYDALFAQLKKLEEKHPELITTNSPTQRVARGLHSEFVSVTHWVPMLSLENSYNAEDLIDWDRKCRELSNTSEIEYCVEPKYDGASISLLYEDDQLLRAATRGNGVEGDDITTNAKQIRSIPLHSPLHLRNTRQIEIRGEVVLTKKNFAAYNRLLIENNMPPLANARNAASGSLRIKDPAEVAKRNLDVFLYHVSYRTADDDLVPDKYWHTHYQSLQSLSELGFKTSLANTKRFDNIEGVIEYVQEVENKRDDYPYEIDGMVIKVNRLDLQDKIGQTSHHPRWAIAFKFKARQATSKLLGIEYQVGRTGSVTPVAKIEPVAVGGVTISSISLFNEDVIREKNLMIGDSILVERAGDVIPYIVKSFAELRNGNESPIQFPTVCPVCVSPLVKPDGEAVARCMNYHCKAQSVERIIHFTSKNAMDIRGLGDAIVRKFYDEKFIQTIADIYCLPYEKIGLLDGFGEKSIQNLKESIEKSKSQSLNRLLFGLGIRYVGETTAKALAASVNKLSDLFEKSLDDLKAIDDVGEKVARSIRDYFDLPETKILIAQLEASGVSLSNTQRNEVGGSLSGYSFLFTGTLSMKRSEAEAMVEKHGGKLLGSVSSKLHYLVVGTDAGSKLEKAKKLNTIRILTEEEFQLLIRKLGTTS